MHNNVYFCDSTAVNSSIRICYDVVWLWKYKELRKLRNKVIIIVECFTEDIKKSSVVIALLNYAKSKFSFKRKQDWKLEKLA